MSECVVRMERVPKNCDDGCWGSLSGECPWCDSIDGYKMVGNRPPNCPIIAVLPEGHGRLVDADAYSAEMKDRQEAAWNWRNEAIAEEDEVKLARAEGAFTAFTEAKLTMDKHIIRQRNSVAELLKEDA